MSLFIGFHLHSHQLFEAKRLKNLCILIDYFTALRTAWGFGGLSQSDIPTLTRFTLSAKFKKNLKFEFSGYPKKAIFWKSSPYVKMQVFPLFYSVFYFARCASIFWCFRTELLSKRKFKWRFQQSQPNSLFEGAVSYPVLSFSTSQRLLLQVLAMSNPQNQENN